MTDRSQPRHSQEDKRKRLLEDDVVQRNQASLLDQLNLDEETRRGVADGAIGNEQLQSILKAQFRGPIPMDAAGWEDRLAGSSLLGELPEISPMQRVESARTAHTMTTESEVQRKTDADSDDPSDWVQTVAGRGVAGSGGAYPYQEQIQEAFGRHDISKVRAHTGGAASEAAGMIQAKAYATGNDVAFGDSPDMHTAAHEAAHIVQQRAGVSLKGGVGQAGDQYEQHADAVADLVVQGKSAEGLLNTMAGSGKSEAVQSKAVQRAVAPAPAEETETKKLSAADIKKAIDYNNGRRLRLDWVRLLQKEMGIPKAQWNNNGTFDAATVQSIAAWQRKEEFKAGDIDGKVGPSTRKALEEKFPSLAYQLLGDNTGERVLVPGNASQKQRFDYYKSIITNAGGVFHDKRVNLLGMRGVMTRDNDGLELYQSGTAATPEESGHFKGSGTKGKGFNDVLISLRMGDDKKAHVKESLGSVDPAGGTAHMRDGQYLYQLGTHGTASPSHQASIKSAYAKRRPGKNPSVDWYEQAGKVRYDALELRRSVEVWRTDTKSGTGNPTKDELTRSDDRVRSNKRNYTSAGYVKTNIHSSNTNTVNSIGCQTVPDKDDYAEIIGDVREHNKGAQSYVREGKESPEKMKNTVLYTLIDASKTLALVECREIATPIGVAPKPSTNQPVSRKESGPNAPTGPGVQEAAARGVAGSGSQLPHLDKIQESFGQHDVTGVQAHTGSAAGDAAKQIGATAYATGNDVAFGASTDLHTAAHEAAHVVQQRAGVSLKGGVGQAGDQYEQHADAVADLVVQGKSAEGLLNTMAGSGRSEAVQSKAVQKDEGATTTTTATATRPQEAPKRTVAVPSVRPVARIKDGVLRNNAINQSYHAFDSAMTQYLGPPLVSNWFTYGQHASREAGEQIKNLQAGIQTLKDVLSILQALSRSTNPWTIYTQALKANRAIKRVIYILDQPGMVSQMVQLLLTKAGVGPKQLRSISQKVDAAGTLDYADFLIPGKQIYEVVRASSALVGLGIDLASAIPSIIVALFKIYGNLKQGNREIYENVAPAVAKFLRATNTSADGVVGGMTFAGDTNGYLAAAFELYSEVRKLSNDLAVIGAGDAQYSGIVEKRNALAHKANLLIGYQEQLVILQPIFETMQQELQAMGGTMVIRDPNGTHPLIADWGDFYTRMGIDPSQAPKDPNDIKGDGALPPLKDKRSGKYKGTIADYFEGGLTDKKIHQAPSKIAPQRKAASPGAPSGDWVQSVAAQGVAGAGGAYPFQSRIQDSFGSHDISGIRAHTGGAAAEAAGMIQAQAYATGSDVAFKGSPDLHTAAHEAAHMIQQRAGVSLKGGVGQAGDRYEQHADAVADLVVQGKSAEGLLNTMAGSGKSTAVQSKAVQKRSSNPFRPRDDSNVYTTGEMENARGKDNEGQTNSKAYKGYLRQITECKAKYGVTSVWGLGRKDIANELEHTDTNLYIAVIARCQRLLASKSDAQVNKIFSKYGETWQYSFKQQILQHYEKTSYVQVLRDAVRSNRQGVRKLSKEAGAIRAEIDDFKKKVGSKSASKYQYLISEILSVLSILPPFLERKTFKGERMQRILETELKNPARILRMTNIASEAGKVSLRSVFPAWQLIELLFKMTHVLARGRKAPEHIEGDSNAKKRWRMSWGSFERDVTEHWQANYWSIVGASKGRYQHNELADIMRQPPDTFSRLYKEWGKPIDFGPHNKLYELGANRASMNSLSTNSGDEWLTDLKHSFEPYLDSVQENVREDFKEASDGAALAGDYIARTNLEQNEMKEHLKDERGKKKRAYSQTMKGMQKNGVVNADWQSIAAHCRVDCTVLLNYAKVRTQSYRRFKKDLPFWDSTADINTVIQNFINVRILVEQLLRDVDSIVDRKSALAFYGRLQGLHRRMNSANKAVKQWTADAIVFAERAIMTSQFMISMCEQVLVKTFPPAAPLISAGVSFLEEFGVQAIANGDMDAKKLLIETGKGGAERWATDKLKLKYPLKEHAGSSFINFSQKLVYSHALDHAVKPLSAALTEFATAVANGENVHVAFERATSAMGSEFKALWTPENLTARLLKTGASELAQIRLNREIKLLENHPDVQSKEQATEIVRLLMYRINPKQAIANTVGN